MTVSVITIQDIPDTDGQVKTNIHYELGDEEKDGPISSAALYGYIVHMLFQNGKINDFIDEAIESINKLENEK